MNDVTEAYKTLQKIAPNHELLKYISIDENGVKAFPDTRASRRFVERFGGDEVNFSGWRDSSKKYDKLGEITFNIYLSSLRKAISNLRN